jgi:hypothetical protein
MEGRDDLSVGDEWGYHYRGLSLQTSPNGEVWWQLYQGTDLLRLNPAPEKIVDRLLDHKRIGGRFHVTERGDALTRVENGEEYEQIYLGKIDDLDGELVPDGAEEYSIDLQPDGLEPGDLWPSIYDGSRYSFVGDRFWWHSGQSHKRHPVPDGLPTDIEQGLQRYKRDGGSFRVLPWGDVITLVPIHPTPEKVEEQFNELPRVVRNIIKLRKDRDVEMLPVYIGSLDDYQIEVNDPTSLTDKLSAEEEESLNSWAQNLGRTEARSTNAHKVGKDTDSGDSTKEGIESEVGDGADEKHPEQGESERLPELDDDPVNWIMRDMKEVDGQNPTRRDST